MSLASTRNVPLVTMRRRVLRSDSDSTSTWLDSTTSLPAGEHPAISIQSGRRSSWRRADSLAEIDESIHWRIRHVGVEGWWTGGASSRAGAEGEFHR